MDTFKVVIDREKNEISVYNNGKGIPIEMHEKEKIWIPELIFGNLCVRCSTRPTPCPEANSADRRPHLSVSPLPITMTTRRN